ncbi:MAG: c-type cytochrome [Verrucomicrobia bacterium]|nr:c-type cytochrome [Verrucomicrobiota bacterium]
MIRFFFTALSVFFLFWRPLTFSQKVDPYADSPHWYKPGHPLDPAEPVGITTLPGFEVEKLISIPQEIGSLTTLTIDDQGRLLVSTQHERGLFRLTPTAIGSREVPMLEVLGGAAENMGWAQGLLYAFDSLYVTVSDTNEYSPTGLYRLLDTDGDGEYDQTNLLLALKDIGEHGPHGLTIGPDNEFIYLMCGNGTPVPENIQRRKTVRTEGIDHIMAPGFENTEYTEGGWVVRMDPDGSNPEIFAGGLRNPYDLAFNSRGDLFTYDSDMEYDLGTPWYRPTRICHIVSGSEFGWRNSAGKWPEYFEDSVAPVVNVGPGSPTGVTFGYGTAFPEKYQKALFAQDWTFATIYAVHLEPEGGSYKGEVETFASGIGLPLTDIVVGADGALYFSVGGRRLGSAIYRIWYSGTDEGDYVVDSNVTVKQDQRNLRLQLESFHGRKDSEAVDAVWNHLGSEDRSIRFAARIALESQPLAEWRSLVFREKRLTIKMPALLALARQGEFSDLQEVIRELEALEIGGLSEEGLLVALRVYELALGRGGTALRKEASYTAGKLIGLLPHSSNLVNRELARVLCYLNLPEVIDPLLDLMEQDSGVRTSMGSNVVARNLKYGFPMLNMMEAAPTLEKIQHAQMLNWIKGDWSLKQRKRYFKLVVDAMQTSKGGKGYQTYWGQILDSAKANLSKRELRLLSREWAKIDEQEPLPEPKGPGRIWELDYMLQQIQNGLGSRDFKNGRKMYAAATCKTCHSIRGEGGIAGPDLTSIGSRFTIRDLLESLIDPGKTISDQYQIMILSLNNGETLSGRIQAKDTKRTVISTNALKPTQTQSIANSDILGITPLPTSTMPPGLLNTLNEEEVLDLIAYLISGGQRKHVLYRRTR